MAPETSGNDAQAGRISGLALGTPAGPAKSSTRTFEGGAAERQMRSVANVTLEDAHDFLKLASDLKIQPRVTTFTLEDANKALLAVKDETENGSAVLVL